MQFHLDGFNSGDPRQRPAIDVPENDEVDVLIIGCGPAGLTLAAQLSVFGGIATMIVDQKEGPLEVGQADGIACRSMEMFAAFGFAEQVKQEAYWVNETTFWRPDEGGQIRRADRIRDVEPGLSEMPHVILNQARVHDHYLACMKNGPRRLEPRYGRRLIALERKGGLVHARFECLKSGKVIGDEEVRARYVVGCDGARSAVRRSLGYELKGEAQRQLWGVMDVLALTDFPDIRLKAAIQSAEAGSLLIIPREGGYMVRLYIELDELAEGERAADRQVNPEALIAKANAILAPYQLDVKQVAWWSAYEIGQRVCDGFDDAGPDRAPRIFIAGDACHTHSPKAGQGMNVSMADTFNLGWKLAAVLRSQAKADLLLTYAEERRAKAQELIEFDRDMARLFSTKPKDGAAAAEFQRYFAKHARYTAGVETRYAPSLIVGDESHQALAAGFQVGTRFHSAPVVRVADARPLELGHLAQADGRWRLFAFAAKEDLGQETGSIAELLRHLEHDSTSILRRFSPAQADCDALFDLRVIFQQPHRNLDLMEMPALLRPTKGRFGLVDYEKVFAPDPDRADIFDLRQIDRDQGALVVARPDQYIAQILPLGEHEKLTEFFTGFLLSKKSDA